jgi:hypothetical protein
MRRYERRLPLISLHIPKCAGTSLMRVLRGWFRDGFYTHYFDERHSQMPMRHAIEAHGWRSRLLRQAFRPGVCIHGHFDSTRGFGVQDYYPNVEQFITVLRDPFEIGLSDYFYAKREGQAWMIAGQAAPITERFRGLPDFFEREMLPRHTYIMNYLPEPVNEANYVDVLRRFIYIGVAEDLDTTMRQMARKLGRPPATLRHANASPRDEPVPLGMRETFVRTHPLEYALYEYALAHYRD